MPEFLRPGVFVIETSFRGKPIEGVATSTAGFVGRAQTGPEGKPTLVTSFTQFTREFGLPYSNPQNMGEYLGHAVQGFFDNGGLRAYIVRVLGAGAAAASSTYDRGTVLRLPSTTTVRGPTTSLPLNSLRNVAVGSLLDVYTRSSTSQPFPGAPTYSGLTVSSYDAVTKTVTLGGGGLPAAAVLDPNNTYVVVQGSTPTAGTGPLIAAENRGASGNNLAVQFRAADLPPVKLNVKKYTRSKPVIGTAGPNTGASLTINATQARQLRVGDQLQFNNGTVVETVTVSAIGNATVNYGALAGAPIDIEGGAKAGTVYLRGRGGTTLFSGTGVPLYTIPAATTVSFGATSVPLPHNVAANLQANDIIFGDDTDVGAATDTGSLTITSIAFAATATLSPALAGDHTSTTITLTNTAGPDGTNGFLGRLLVTDTTGLATPARRAAGAAPTAYVGEQIYVTDGVKSDTATIRLVDTATNSVVYDLTTWPNITLNGWTSFESLQVAAGGDTVISVSSTASFYVGASVKFDDGNAPQYRLVNAVDAGAKTVTLDSGLSGTSYINVPGDPTLRKAYLQVLEMDALVYDGGSVVKTFSGLSWNNNAIADSFRKYYVNRINDTRSGSAYVSVTSTLPIASDNGSVGNAPATATGFPLNLGATVPGDDGAAPININMIGTDNGPGNRTGIQSLIEREDIAIVAVPGVTDVAVQGALITHCELLKYRFAVLDGLPNTSDVSAIQAHRNNYDTKYAAYYEPWMKKLDLTTGNELLVPPSGHVIGIYARSDNERGVHKAPANEVVRNILELQYQFGNGEQEVLNPVGVNLIRTFTGRGIRVWGARTISSDSEWKYINVRRLFIYMEHSIDNGTQWVVFEPNNEQLWARVKSTIESFLVGVWKTGALMGTKPEDAFFVKCDRTTMTQDDIDNGRLIVLIGVAPTFPAEFVIFKIGQFTASSPA